jgi:hypothetical protein
MCKLITIIWENWQYPLELKQVHALKLRKSSLSYMPQTNLYIYTFLSFLYSTWDWTQGSMLARQILYYLSHTPSTFFVCLFVCFSDGVLCFYLAQPQTSYLCHPGSWDYRPVPPPHSYTLMTCTLFCLFYSLRKIWRYFNGEVLGNRRNLFLMGLLETRASK